MRRYRTVLLVLLFGVLPMVLVLILAVTVILPSLNQPEAAVEQVEVIDEEPPPEPVKKRVALAALQALPAGTLLSAGDVTLIEVNDEELATNQDQYVYVGEVEKLADAEPRRDMLRGFAVRRALTAGEPITRGAVVGPDEAQFLATVLAADRVAVSIPVSLATRQAKLVSPGNRVDVLLAVEQDGELVVRTIVEDVRVIAVNSRVIAEEDVRRAAPTEAAESEGIPAEEDLLRPRPEVITVTLEVRPVHGEYLALGAYEGQLSLAIRGLAAAPQRLGEPIQNLRSVLRLPDEEPDEEPHEEPHAVVEFIPAPPQPVEVRVVRGNLAEEILTFTNGEGVPASAAGIPGIVPGGSTGITGTDPTTLSGGSQ